MPVGEQVSGECTGSTRIAICSFGSTCSSCSSSLLALLAPALASTLLVVSFLFLLGCINSLFLVVTKCITRSNLRECWAQSPLRSLCYGCSSAEACQVLSGEGDYFGWWLVVCNKIAHHGKESMVAEHETDRLSHCVHNQEAKSLECRCCNLLSPLSLSI